MSEHLPECGQYCDGKPPKCRGGDCTLCDEVDCICPALRACEERIWDEAYAAGFNAGRAHGESRACSLSYRHGLDAAREAVVAQSMACRGPAMPGSEFVHTESIIAAIDALKETADE